MLATDLDTAAFEEALAAWTPSRTPEELVAEWQLRDRLAALLDTMDERLRAVVWLIDVEGFHQREVASMLELPEGTVASRLFRARRWLRDALRESEHDVRARRER
jgi:RNA polymerase sigma-70 factor, ECF subfamily